jgi:repressor LexA
MQELTPRQASILKFIELFISKHQQPPAEREIAAHFRIHQSAIRKHLNALEKKGHLELRRDGRSRGIRLRGVSAAVPVPMLDPVAGPGEPLESTRSMMLDSDFVGTEDAFLFSMEGDSMSDVGIYDGDLLLVRRALSVRNGEVVVALLEGRPVVRRYFEIAGRVVLEPANRRYRPVTVHDPDAYQLLGRVAALIRSLAGISVRKRVGSRKKEEERQ